MISASSSTSTSTAASAATLVFTVKNMTCADCSTRLEERLSTDVNVESARVSLMTSTARVVLQRPRLNLKQSDDINHNNDAASADAAAAADVAVIVLRLIASAAILGFPLILRPTAGAHLFLHKTPQAFPVTKTLPSVVIAEHNSGSGSGSVCSKGSERASISYDPVLIGARHILGVLLPKTIPTFPVICTHDDHNATAAAAATNSFSRSITAFLLIFTPALTRLIAASILTMTSIALSLIEGDIDDHVTGILTRGTLIELILATLAMGTLWPHHALSAYNALRSSGSANYDTLITISTGASYILAISLTIAGWSGLDASSAFGEPPYAATATLLGIVAIAHELEERARAATSSALESLKSRDTAHGRIIKQAPCIIAAAVASSSIICKSAALETSCIDCDNGWEMVLATTKEVDVTATIITVKNSDGSSIDDGAAANAVVLVTSTSIDDTLVPPPPPPPPLIHSTLLQLNDEVVVLSGEVIPTDGIVIRNTISSSSSSSSSSNSMPLGSADESMLTGESVPVPKMEGDMVYGGSRNTGENTLRVRTTQLAGSGTLAHIVSLISDAQATRPRTQTRLDAIARIFTPFVIVTSFVVLGVWWGAAEYHVITQPHAPFAFALQFALSLLVVACPCALALAVAPVTLVATLCGAKVGLLIAGGGVALETGASVDTIIFDKTGTLTEGRASVQRVSVCDRGITHAAAAALGVKPPERVSASAAKTGISTSANSAAVYSTDATLLLGAAAAVALNSSHPLSAAIRAAAISAHIILPESACRGEERHAETGRGVRAIAPDGEILLLGAPDWLEKEEGVKGALAAASQARAAGRSVVALACDGELAGVIELDDAVRGGAFDLIKRLRVRGFRILIASGDGVGAVERAADTAGVPRDDAFAALSPERKVALVRAEQENGKCVMFVGDGVNDAAALTAADVGVAMASGDVSTRSTADVILQRDDVSGVERFILLAKSARNVVRGNILYSAFYNVIAMPLAAGVLWPAVGIVVIPPALAGIGEIVSTIPVLASASLLWCLRL